MACLMDASIPATSVASRRKQPRRQSSLQVAYYPSLFASDAENTASDKPSVTWKISANNDSIACNPGISRNLSDRHSFARMGTRSYINVTEAAACGDCTLRRFSDRSLSDTKFDANCFGDPVLNKPSFSFAENSDGMISNANNGGLLEALTAPGDPEPDPDDPSRQWKQRNRHQLWSIAGGGAGAAYHQSFDERLRSASRQSFSNSCSNLDDQVRRSQCKRRAAISGGRPTVPLTVCNACGQRPPALGCGRSPQSSFDSNGDVAQISLNWMRLNGALPQFRTLLEHSSVAATSAAGGGSSGSSGNTRKVSATRLNRLDSLGDIRPPHSSGRHAQYLLNTANGSFSNKHPPRRVSDPTRIASLEVPLERRLNQRKLELVAKIAITLKIFAFHLMKFDAGDLGSKKSISLGFTDDLEAQHGKDDSESPLMREKATSSGRLVVRQALLKKRRITSDYALFFALLGIALMVVENEMNAAHFYSKQSPYSYLLKTLILISTAILLFLVGKFHLHEVQLFMNDNSAEDWRIVLTPRRIVQISIEMAICCVCPMPVDVSFAWTTVHADGETVTTTFVPVDVLLSIPMFFRLYWLCRVMLLHSRLFTDASSRSIGALNRINLNARFVLKTLMTLCPGTMLMVFTASLWVMAAWVLRLCERHHVGSPINIHAQKHQNYLNSLWMIAITFLSVGYGDVVPNTYCGRAVAVVTGILGTCTSSMVVAVIARKLELSRAEKHVHNFMMDTQLTKKLKHSAANVIRETWLIYKNRRLVDKIDPPKIRLHQRKFLVAIYAMRKVRRDQRKLAENSASIGDVAKTSSNTYEMLHDVHGTQEGMSMRITAVEQQLGEIQRDLGTIADLIRTIARQRSEDVAGGDEQSPASSDVRRRRAAPVDL